MISVWDRWCPGDFYEIYINGEILATTPNLGPPWGCSYVGPWSEGCYTTVSLPPGVYTITIRDASFDAHPGSELMEQLMCPAGFFVMGAPGGDCPSYLPEPEYCQPVLIGLSSFTATPSNRQVILKWTTESEIDNAGFNLYRSEAEGGEYVKINDSLIPAEGSSTQGASYQYVDSNVKNRTTYYYKLEDIDINGTSTMHGPVSATPRRIGVNR
jgi:hypothetical protein